MNNDYTRNKGGVWVKKAEQLKPKLIMPEGYINEHGRVHQIRTSPATTDQYDERYIRRIG